MRDFLTSTISASYSSAVRCESGLFRGFLASEASIDCPFAYNVLPPPWIVDSLETAADGTIIPGIGSLDRSVMDIIKMVPSTPAEIMYFPSGDSSNREISPM
jgi:hypothetical protein